MVFLFLFLAALTLTCWHWLTQPAAKEFCFFFLAAVHITNEMVTKTQWQPHTPTESEAKNSFTREHFSRRFSGERERPIGRSDAVWMLWLWHTHQYHLSYTQHNIPFWLPLRSIIHNSIINFFSIWAFLHPRDSMNRFSGPPSFVRSHCVCFFWQLFWLYSTYDVFMATNGASFFPAQMGIEYIVHLSR